MRKRRLELGLTMWQAAERCGVDQATISRIEAGKQPNTAWRIVLRLARGLEIDLYDLALLEKDIVHAQDT